MLRKQCYAFIIMNAKSGCGCVCEHGVCVCVKHLPSQVLGQLQWVTVPCILLSSNIYKPSALPLTPALLPTHYPRSTAPPPSPVCLCSSSRLYRLHVVPLGFCLFFRLCLYVHWLLCWFVRFHSFLRPFCSLSSIFHFLLFNLTYLVLKWFLFIHRLICSLLYLCLFFSFNFFYDFGCCFYKPCPYENFFI